MFADAEFIYDTQCDESNVCLCVRMYIYVYVHIAVPRHISHATFQ